MVVTVDKPGKIICREIGADTLTAVERLLAEGFPERSPAFWARAIARLAARRCPAGYPRFGHLLMNEADPVGCILTIYSERPSKIGHVVYCDLAAFYAQRRFRPFASMLTLRALRDKEVTYLNLSPRANTLAMVEAQGYQRYCIGTLAMAASLSPAQPGVEVEVFDAQAPATAGLSGTEHRLLADHAGWGCTSLVCREADRTSPFVFQRRRYKRLLPAAQLLYCRNIDDFARLAGNLGRYLARRWAPVVLVDTDGATTKLKGTLLSLPKYFKGPVRPRIGDLAYTEFPIVGI